MNKAILIGRLTKDCDLKFTQNDGKAVASFTIAVDKFVNGEKGADYIAVVVWGKIAENVANFTSKGSLVAVCGRLQSRSYDAKDGSKRYVTEVVASEVQFLSKGQQASNETASDSGFEGMTGDLGDSPF
jgi:single-strand DNA-binding protein